MDWKELFFSLQGRINRIPFWIGILVLSAVIWGPLLPFGSMLPQMFHPLRMDRYWKPARD